MNCPECDRVWRAYAEATRRHNESIRAQEAAAASDGMESMKVLEETIRLAEQKRSLARDAVRGHDSSHSETKAAPQD
jgi:hypothetical protein